MVCMLFLAFLKENEGKLAITGVSVWRIGTVDLCGDNAGGIISFGSSVYRVRSSSLASSK